MIPSMSEYQRPVMSSRGVTVKANVIWLKLAQFSVDAW